jgi:protein subunit release factor A
MERESIDVRVIDQRVGMGVGGFDTVIRIYHKSTGLLVEVPRITGSQSKDYAIALEMLETALTHPDYLEKNHD